MNDDAFRLVQRSVEVNSTTDDERWLEQLRITRDKELPPMHFLFRIFGKPCFPRGELVAVTGKAKSGKTLFNSLLMAIRHLPQTILMMVVSVLPVAILFIPEPMATIQSILLLLLILMGFSTIAYCNSFFLVKIFDNYIPKDGDSDDDSGAQGELIEDSTMEAAIGGNGIPNENTDQQESTGE